MYSVETAKMSSKGQLVIPDVFRKSYGWKAGMTLLMIGTGNAVVLQSLDIPSDESVDRVVAGTKPVGDAVAARFRKAKEALARLDRMGITLPDGIENGDVRRRALMEKYA